MAPSKTLSLCALTFSGVAGSLQVAPTSNFNTTTQGPADTTPAPEPFPPPPVTPKPCPVPAPPPAPESDTTPAPEFPTTPAPEFPTTPAPEFNTTAAPEFSTTAAPEFSTTAAPEFSTTAAPGPGPTPAPGPEPTPLPGNVTTPAPSGTGMQIQSTVSSLCVDLPGGDASNGALLWTWDCYGGANQQWSFQDGQLVYLPDPSKCVDLLGGDATNGNQLGIWDCLEGQESQMWGFDSEWGTIYLSSSSTAADATKCAQIGGENPGDPLVIWDCTVEPQQVWTVGSPNATAVVV